MLTALYYRSTSVLFAINSLLQAFKKPVWTLIIGIYRQGLAVTLFIYIFVILLGFGTLGVWLGVATSVITGLLFSIIMTEGIARKKIGSILFSKPIDVAKASQTS